MMLRSFALVPLAALALAPLPAAAGSRGADTSEAVRQMQDPRNQEKVGQVMGTLFTVLMSMPADPFVQVMEAAGEKDAARRIPKGATLGDLAGADARRVPGEIKRAVPGMMTAAGTMLGALEQIAPQLEGIGKQMEKDLGRAD